MKMCGRKFKIILIVWATADFMFLGDFPATLYFVIKPGFEVPFKSKGGAAGDSGAGSFSLDKKGCLVPGV